MLKTVCDRCGTIFSPYEEEINLKEKYWRLSILYDYHPYPADKIDLCPKCKKELLKWLNINKEGDVFAKK